MGHKQVNVVLTVSWLSSERQRRLGDAATIFSKFKLELFISKAGFHFLRRFKGGCGFAAPCRTLM